MMVSPLTSADTKVTFDFDESTVPQVPITQAQSSTSRKLRSTTFRILSKHVQQYIPEIQQHAKFVKDVHV